MGDAMSDNTEITVEVAYALPHKQALIKTTVPEGTTALEAARASGISERFEGLDLDNAKLGIFGKAVPAKQVVQEGDRVEIYRPLIADPKQVRKERAAKAREKRASEKG